MTDNCFKAGDKVSILDNENKGLVGKIGTLLEVKDDSSGSVVLHTIEIADTKAIVVCDDPNCLTLLRRGA